MYWPFKMNLYLFVALQIVLSSADLLNTNSDNDLNQVEKASAKRIISRIFIPRHKLDSQKTRGSRILDIIRNRLHKNLAVASNDNSNDLSSEAQSESHLQDSILKLLARRNEDESDEAINTAKQETELNADILSALLENINASNINADGNKIRKGKLIIYYGGDKSGEEVKLDDSTVAESPDEERVRNINAEILDLYNKLNVSVDVYNSVLEKETGGEEESDARFIALLRALYKNGLYDGVDPRILKRELSALMVKYNIQPSEDLYWFTPTSRSGDIDIYDDSDKSLEIEDIINNILGNKKSGDIESEPNKILVIPVNNKSDKTKDITDNGDDDNKSPNEDMLSIILSQGKLPQNSDKLKDSNQDLSVSRTGSIKPVILTKPKGADMQLSNEEEIPDIAVIGDKTVHPLNILDELKAASKKINYNIFHKHKYNEHSVSTEDIDNLINGSGSNEAGILNDLFSKITLNESSLEDDANGNEPQPIDNSGFYSSDLSSLKHLINLALREPLVNKYHRRILSNKPIKNVNNIRGKPFLIYVVFPHNHHKKHSNHTENDDVDLLQRIKSSLSNRENNLDHDSILQKIQDLLRSGPEDDDSQEGNNDNQVKRKIENILQLLLEANKRKEFQGRKERKEQSIWEIIQELDRNKNNRQKSKGRPDRGKLIEVILQWLAERKRNKNESGENNNLQAIHDVIALIMGNQSNGQKQPIDEDIYDQFKKGGSTWLIDLIQQLKNNKKESQQQNDVDLLTDRLIKNIIRIIRVLKAQNVPGPKIRVVIERLIQKGLLEISGRSVSACTKKINQDLIRGIQNALAKYAP